MIILPAIDIKDGNCVRLFRGDFHTTHKVAESAADTATKFLSAGSGWMHMVDLDGAKSGNRKNREMILNTVKSTKLKVELGGGIRDMESVEDYLSNGVKRVILGSAALHDPNFVKEAVLKYDDAIAVGIDARASKVATQGWLETSDTDYLDFARMMEQIGVKVIIFTDIACDGMLSGPNFEQLKQIKDAVNCKIIASGGIRDIGHIKKLAGLGLYGAICGKSIYSGTLNLEEAIAAGGMQNE